MFAGPCAFYLCGGKASLGTLFVSAGSGESLLCALACNIGCTTNAHLWDSALYSPLGVFA